MVRMTILLGLLVYPFGLFADSYAQRCLTLAAGTGPLTRFLANHFIEAMKTRGLCFTIRHLPPKRASVELVNGTVDGELLRIATYGKSIKQHAVIVPEALIKGKGMIITREPGISDFKSFQRKPVTYPRGIKWAARITANFTDVFPVDNKKNGVEMVQAGRADAMFIDNVAWTAIAAQFPDLHASFVLDLSAHMFLSVKHKKRIPVIAAAIRDHREAEGGIPEILKRFKKLKKS